MLPCGNMFFTHVAIPHFTVAQLLLLAVLLNTVNYRNAITFCRRAVIMFFAFVPITLYIVERILCWKMRMNFALRFSDF